MRHRLKSVETDDSPLSLLLMCLCRSGYGRLRRVQRPKSNFAQCEGLGKKGCLAGRLVRPLNSSALDVSEDDGPAWVRVHARGVVMTWL